jgi:hypothetical protein
VSLSATPQAPMRLLIGHTGMSPVTKSLWWPPIPSGCPESTATGAVRRLDDCSRSVDHRGGVRSARIAVTAQADGVGLTADTSSSWPSPFADASCTVSMTAVADSGTIGLAALSQTASGFTFRATNTGASAASARCFV